MPSERCECGGPLVYLLRQGVPTLACQQCHREYCYRPPEPPPEQTSTGSDVPGGGAV